MHLNARGALPHLDKLDDLLSNRIERINNRDQKIYYLKGFLETDSFNAPVILRLWKFAFYKDWSDIINKIIGRGTREQFYDILVMEMMK